MKKRMNLSIGSDLGFFGFEIRFYGFGFGIGFGNLVWDIKQIT